MAAGVALSVLTGLVWTAMAAVFSHIVGGRGRVLGLLTVSGLIALVGFAGLLVRWSVVWNGPVPHGLALAVTQTASGAFTALGYFAMQRAMSRGPHGLVWTIGQSALVMPLLFAVIWFGQPLRPWAGGGVLLLLISLVVLGRVRGHDADGTPHHGAAWLGWALLCLLMFGAAQTLASMPSQWPDFMDIARVRPALYALGMFVCYLAALWRPNGHGGRADVPVPWRGAMLHGLLTIASLLCIYAALDALGAVRQAGLMYPITVAVSVVAFLIYTAVVRKENPGPWGYSGAALATLAIILMAIS